MAAEEKFVTVEAFTGKPIEAKDLLELLENAKVPAGLKVEKGVYQDNDCANVIFPNLPANIQEKLPVEKLKELLTIQGDYVTDTEKEEILDEENLEYLAKTCEEKKIPLKLEDIEEVFEQELVYLYLIGVL